MTELSMISCDVVNVIYQTQKSVFDHTLKDREESLKFDALQSIFDKLWVVWKFGQTLTWEVWYVFSIETKRKKTEKQNHLIYAN